MEHPPSAGTAPGTGVGIVGYTKDHYLCSVPSRSILQAAADSSSESLQRAKIELDVLNAELLHKDDEMAQMQSNVRKAKEEV